MRCSAPARESRCSDGRRSVLKAHQPRCGGCWDKGGARAREAGVVGGRPPAALSVRGCARRWVGEEPEGKKLSAEGGEERITNPKRRQLYRKKVPRTKKCEAVGRSQTEGAVREKRQQHRQPNIESVPPTMRHIDKCSRGLHAECGTPRRLFIARLEECWRLGQVRHVLPFL